ARRPPAISPGLPSDTAARPLLRRIRPARTVPRSTRVASNTLAPRLRRRCTAPLPLRSAPVPAPRPAHTPACSLTAVRYLAPGLRLAFPNPHCCPSWPPLARTSCKLLCPLSRTAAPPSAASTAPQPG